MACRLRGGDPDRERRPTIELLDTYLSALAVASVALLLVLSGFAKKQLAWRRRRATFVWRRRR
jgi:hypothetical protein